MELEIKRPAGLGKAQKYGKVKPVCRIPTCLILILFHFEKNVLIAKNLCVSIVHFTQDPDVFIAFKLHRILVC